MNDRYLKTVLTVIACALVAIATENAIPVAHAQLGTMQKVQICDDLHCAGISEVSHGFVGTTPIRTYSLSVAQDKQTN